jgi:hypothetical protein
MLRSQQEKKESAIHMQALENRIKLLQRQDAQSKKKLQLQQKQITNILQVRRNIQQEKAKNEEIRRQ